MLQPRRWTLAFSAWCCSKGRRRTGWAANSKASLRKSHHRSEGEKAECRALYFTVRATVVKEDRFQFVLDYIWRHGSLPFHILTWKAQSRENTPPWSSTRLHGKAKAGRGAANIPHVQNRTNIKEYVDMYNNIPLLFRIWQCLEFDAGPSPLRSSLLGLILKLAFPD